jgi:hypothetical protein
MRFALRPTGIVRGGNGGILETTLLELVRAVSEVTEDDREVVATVMELLRSGRVRLSGSFRGCFPDAA